MMNSTEQTLLAVSIVFPVLALIFVILRLAARNVRSAGYAADDWATVAALIVCFGLAINSITCVGRGAVGNSAAALGLVKATVLLKVLFADCFLCFTSLAVVKVAVLLFYKRIFISKRFILAANGIIVAVILWLIASLIALLFSETPISAHWDLMVKSKDNINFPAFLLVHASLDLAFDIIILCLPIPTIRKLNMSRRRKIGLIAVFWLGSFCAISESVRIYYFHKFLAGNFGHDAIGSVVSNALIWSRIEPCCSVIAACLPTLPPLFKDGRGPQSIVASIRSVLSLRSLSNVVPDTDSKQSLGGSNHWRRVDDNEEGRHAWVGHNAEGVTTIEMDPTNKKHDTQGEIMTQTTFSTRSEET